jgi:hypothetical protein
VVAVRADFDALPINETMDVRYKCQNPGAKHATAAFDIAEAVLPLAVRPSHDGVGLPGANALSVRPAVVQQ